VLFVVFNYLFALCCNFLLEYYWFGVAWWRNG